MRVQDTEFSPQEITKRWLWRLGLLFLFFLAALVATFIVWRVSLSRKIDRALAAIQSAGYPTNLAQLEQKYYPYVASDENAAPFFLNAFASLHETNSAKLKISDLPYYQSTNKSKFFSQTNLDVIAKLLTDNRDALELLHQSPTATNCRYPINLSLGYGTLLPHLEPLKNSARLLSLEAIVHAKNGETTAGIEDLNAIFRLLHSLDREPLLISQLVRMSAETLVITSLEHMLNSQQFSDAQLASLYKTFDHTENPAAIEHAMATELCNGTGAFQNLGLTIPPPGAPRNSGYGLISLTGFFDRDHYFFVVTMAEHLRLAPLSFPKKLDAEMELDKRVSQETSNHYYLLSSLLLPSLSHAYTKECSVAARRNIIRTVLGVERYRLANQDRLPDKLSDLVPAFLNSIPADPFDGKPIRYKKLAKGYMVYSVGEDRKDDGGVYAYRPKPGAASDITFVVER